MRVRLGIACTALVLVLSASERRAAAQEAAPSAPPRQSPPVERPPPLTASLVVRLAPDVRPEGYVHVDGRILQPDELGQPLAFEPGPHTVTTVTPWHRAWVAEVTLREGETTEVLAHGGAAYPVGMGPQAIVGTTLVAAAGALLTSSAVTGALALEAGAVAERECTPDGCTAEGLEASREGERLEPAAIGTLVSGLLLVTPGVVLMLTGRMVDHENHRRWAASVAPLPGGAMASLRVALD